MVFLKLFKISLLRRSRRQFFTLVIPFLFSLFVILFVLSVQFDYFKPYYLIDYPSYKFIITDTQQSKSQHICSPFLANTSDLKIKIDNDFYPKLIPIFQNRSLNFTCLNSSPRIKTILLWNKFTGDPIIPIDPNNSMNILKRTNCPVTNCDITLDKSRLNTSDMILFHMRSRIDEFPKIRFSHQKWVYLIYESQQHCPMCSKLDGLFNLSATFRSDSDITNIYLTDSRLKWVENNPNFNEKNYDPDVKKGFAAILISSCSDNLKRLKIIKELRRFINVDIYGKCSDQNLKCPSQGDCREYLANNYKFFLAFENSICSEYITEKFFNTLNYNTLPVVLGGGDYSKYMPKSSFINMLDFSNLEELGMYMNYLSSNKTAYLEYFKARQYLSTVLDNPKHSNFCEMCIRLQLEEFTGIEHKIFRNHAERMGMPENCKAIRFKKINNKNFMELVSSPDYVKMKFYES